MRSKIKILSVGPYGEKRIGGVQYVTNMILNFDFKKKYDFIILDTTIPEFFHKWRIFRFILTIQFSGKLIWILIRRHPDLMHIHSANVASILEKGLLIILTRIFSSTRIILHMHGSRLEYILKYKPLFRKILKQIFKITDVVIILSEVFRKQLRLMVGHYPYIIIPHGVDTALYNSVKAHALNDGCIHIAFIGSIGQRKGCYELGDALTKLVDEYQIRNIHLEMVGEEEYPGELTKVKAYYEKIGISPFVTFHGLKTGKEKIQILKQSHIFVLPSRHDSFGIVNLEAMAAGLPVISTKQGAIPEYLVDGENGFLFEIGDAETLAEKMLILYSNEDLRREMGEKNKKKIEAFYSFTQILKKYDALYQAVYKNQLQEVIQERDEKVKNANLEC